MERDSVDFSVTKLVHQLPMESDTEQGNKTEIQHSLICSTWWSLNVNHSVENNEEVKKEKEKGRCGYWLTFRHRILGRRESVSDITFQAPSQYLFYIYFFLNLPTQLYSHISNCIKSKF